MDNPQLMQDLVASANRGGEPAKDQPLNGMHAQQSQQNNQDVEQKNVSVSAAAPATQEVAANRCQADGCLADLSGLRRYFRRYHVCETHIRAQVVLMGGRQMRFCDQCSTFHLLSLFDGTRRTCREKLEHNRMKRRLRKAQGTGAAPAAASVGSRPMNAVSAPAAMAAAAGGPMTPGGNQSDDADSDDQPDGRDGEDGGTGSPRGARRNGAPPGRGRVRRRQSVQSLVVLRRQMPAPRQGVSMDVTRAVYGNHQQERGGSGSPESDVDEPDRRGERWGLTYSAAGGSNAMGLGGAAAGPEALLANGGMLGLEADSGAPLPPLPHGDSAPSGDFALRGAQLMELSASHAAAGMEWARHAQQDLRDQEPLPQHVFTPGQGMREGRLHQLASLPPLQPHQQQQVRGSDDWLLEDRRRAAVDLAAVERAAHAGVPGAVARRPLGGSVPHIPQNLQLSPVVAAGEGVSRATWPSLAHGPSAAGLQFGSAYHERCAAAGPPGHHHQQLLDAQAAAGAGLQMGSGAPRVQALGLCADSPGNLRPHAVSVCQVDDATLGALDAAAALGIPLMPAQGEQGYDHGYGPAGTASRGGHLLGLLSKSNVGLGADSGAPPGPGGIALALQLEAGLQRETGAGEPPGAPNRRHAVAEIAWRRQQQQQQHQHPPPLQHYHAGLGSVAEAAAAHHHHPQQQQQHHSVQAWIEHQASAPQGNGFTAGGQLPCGKNVSLSRQHGTCGPENGRVVQQPLSPGSSIYSADEEAQGMGLNTGGGADLGGQEVDLVLSDQAASMAAAFARDWTERELDALAAAGQDVRRLSAPWVNNDGCAVGSSGPQRELQQRINEMQYAMARRIEAYQQQHQLLGHQQDTAMQLSAAPHQHHPSAGSLPTTAPPSGLGVGGQNAFGGESDTPAILGTDSFKQEVYMLEQLARRHDDQHGPRYGPPSLALGRPPLEYSLPAPLPQHYQHADGAPGLGALQQGQPGEAQPGYSLRAYTSVRQALQATQQPAREAGEFTAFRSLGAGLDLETDESPPGTARGVGQHCQAPPPASEVPTAPQQYPYGAKQLDDPYAQRHGRQQAISQHQDLDYPPTQEQLPAPHLRVLGMQHGQVLQPPSGGAERLVLRVPGQEPGFPDEPTPTAAGPAAPRWGRYGTAGPGPGVGVGPEQQDHVLAGAGTWRAGEGGMQQPPAAAAHHHNQQQQHQILLVAAQGSSSSLLPACARLGSDGGGCRNEGLPAGRLAHAARAMALGTGPARLQAPQWGPADAGLDSLPLADGSCAQPMPHQHQQPHQHQLAQQRLHGFDSLPPLHSLTSVDGSQDPGRFSLSANSGPVLQQDGSLGLLEHTLLDASRSRRLQQLDQAAKSEAALPSPMADARMPGGGVDGGSGVLPPGSTQVGYCSREDGRPSATPAPGLGLQARAGPAGGGGWQPRAGLYGEGIERGGIAAWHGGASRGPQMLQLQGCSDVGGLAATGRGEHAALEVAGGLGSPGAYSGAGGGGIYHAQYGGNTVYDGVNSWGGGGAVGSRLSHVALKLSHAPVESLPPDLAERFQGGLKGGSAALPPTVREGCIEVLVEVLHSGPIETLCEQLFGLPELNHRTPVDVKAAAAGAARARLRELVGSTAFDVCERVTLQLLGGPVLSCRPGTEPELLTWSEATKQAGVACAASWPDLLLLLTGPPVLLAGPGRKLEVLLYGPTGLRKHMDAVRFGVRMAGGAGPLGEVTAEHLYNINVEAVSAAATVSTETEAWQDSPVRRRAAQQPGSTAAEGQGGNVTTAVNGVQGAAFPDSHSPERYLRDVAACLQQLSRRLQHGREKPSAGDTTMALHKPEAAADGAACEAAAMGSSEDSGRGVQLRSSRVSRGKKLPGAAVQDVEETQQAVDGLLLEAGVDGHSGASQQPPQCCSVCGGARGEFVPSGCGFATGPLVPHGVSSLGASSGDDVIDLPRSCFSLGPQPSIQLPAAAAAPKPLPPGQLLEQQRVVGMEAAVASPPQPPEDGHNASCEPSPSPPPMQLLQRQQQHEQQHEPHGALVPEDGRVDDALAFGGPLSGPDHFVRQAASNAESVPTPHACCPSRRQGLGADSVTGPSHLGTSSTEPNSGGFPRGLLIDSHRSPALTTSTPSTPVVTTANAAATASTAAGAVISSSGDGSLSAQMSSRSSASLTITSLYERLSLRSEWSWNSTLRSSFGHASTTTTTTTSLYGTCSGTGEPLPLTRSSGCCSCSTTETLYGSRNGSEERISVPGRTPFLSATASLGTGHTWAGGGDADSVGGGGGAAANTIAAAAAGSACNRLDSSGLFAGRTGSRRRAFGLAATHEEAPEEGLDDPGVVAAPGADRGVWSARQLLLHFPPNFYDAVEAAAAAGVSGDQAKVPASASAASEPLTPVLFGVKALSAQRPPPPPGGPPPRRVLVGGSCAGGPEVLRLQLPPVRGAGLMLLEVMAGHSVVACWPLLAVETARQLAELSQLWQDMSGRGRQAAWRSLAADLGLVLAHLPRFITSGELQPGLRSFATTPPKVQPLGKSGGGDGAAAAVPATQGCELPGLGSEPGPSLLTQRSSLDNPSYANSTHSWGTAASHGSSGLDAHGASPSVLPSMLARSGSDPSCVGGEGGELQPSSGSGGWDASAATIKLSGLVAAAAAVALMPGGRSSGRNDADGGCDANWDAHAPSGTARAALALPAACSDAGQTVELLDITDPTSLPVGRRSAPGAVLPNAADLGTTPGGEAAPLLEPAGGAAYGTVSSGRAVAALSRQLEMVQLGSPGSSPGAPGALEQGQLEQGQGCRPQRGRGLELPGGPPALSEAATAALRSALSRLRAFVYGRRLPALSELLSRVAAS